MILQDNGADDIAGSASHDELGITGRTRSPRSKAGLQWQQKLRKDHIIMKAEQHSVQR